MEKPKETLEKSNPQGLNLSIVEIGVLERQRSGDVSDPAKDDSAFLSVLKYASPRERFALVVGCLCCIVGGALNPLLTVIYGQLVGTFQSFTNDEIPGSRLSSEVSRFSLYFVYLAIGMFVFTYVATVSFFLCGEKITQRLRLSYLRSVLRQNMAFFDVLGSGTVTTSLTSDVNLVHDALSAKVSLTLTAAATCVTAVIITFIMYWKLALVLVAGTVITMTLINVIGTRFAVRFNRRALDATAKSNAIAEETLQSRKHVAAFGIQKELGNKYADYLRQAKGHSLRARAAVASTIAGFMGVMYLSSGLSFWQGSRFLVLGEISASHVVTCSMAVLISALTIGKVAPNAQAFVSGISGASRLLESIRRGSPLDPLSSTGQIPQQVQGQIELKGVRLVYPSRPDKLALRGVDIVFPAGKKTAVIGPSGCGKSSIVGLIERFYSPISGSISLDGVNICDINLQWLRQQVALVSQEPVLFKGTVFDNICNGIVSKMADIPSEQKRVDKETCELVYGAAKMANAHEFILSLPRGYDTDVGEMGDQLSGGQRQRIAIARAIVGNPQILLLDEATAALDTASEQHVLDALKTASRGRTTIFITHRLSSVRDAEQIVVMSEGQVVETGTHESLIAQKDGVYASMLDRQRILGSNGTSEVVDNFHSQEISDGSSKPSTDRYHDNSEQAPTISRTAETTPNSGSPSSPARKSPEVKYPLSALLKMSFSLNKSEMHWVLLGVTCCLLSGALIPVQSLFFAHSIDALSLPPPDYSELRSTIDFWCLMYLMLGLVAFLTWGIQGFSLAYCSEALVYAARIHAFQSILRQDMAFFGRSDGSDSSKGQQQHQNTTGSLMSILTTSATQLAGLGGAVLSTILTAFATLAGGIILSFIIGWKLAIVCTATVPVVLTCGWLRLRVLSNMEANAKASYAESAAYASEAIASIRTVAAFCMEKHITKSYHNIINRTAARNRKSILYSSALYAASQSAVFLVAALGFWYGGTLIADHSYSMLQYFVCFAALVSGSQSVGAVFSFAPDLSRAMTGAQEFKRLFDTIPTIDIWSKDGIEICAEKCQGAIELQDVSFSYEDHSGAADEQNSTTPRMALSNFNLKIAPRQTVALVGHSGCGKSTVISMLERFIDPTTGSITLDGVNLRDLNLKKYRSLISLVGQEPVLYQGSIRENLTLGVGRTDVLQEDIEDACNQANILRFVQSLPDGFDTEVGSRGVMLSGGQKQRIAIARALLRNTPILLLDEATSALDGEAEAAVQEALDAAAHSRTTIVVAHRLKTVRDADLICVMEQGRIIEKGTHNQLMAQGSTYAGMVQLQSHEDLS